MLRGTTPGGPYTEVGRVSGAAVTTYTDTTVATNTTYLYVVRTTAGGWISANSNEASVTTPLSCP
ncbi:MAG: hypothetical protein M3N57_06275 [Actinomycetota bacterium]|nr:hypothetical protein [Actinomycetota bacterium]